MLHESSYNYIMKVTKYAHSCLLIEVNGIRILTDLGSMNTQIPDIADLSAVLITHEHQDHFEPEKLKIILQKNPSAKVITHAAVGAKLDEAGIAYVAIEPGQSVDIRGFPVESYGTEHAIIYGTSPCRNTGYLIAERLFIPGDALHDFPSKPIEILALPTGGPWMKISEAIDYGKAVKPKIVFPIHDAMYTSAYKQTAIPRWIGAYLEAEGIEFVNMADNSSKEF